MNKNDTDITAAELRSLMAYDPDTGIFQWKERPQSDFTERKFALIWNGRFAGRVIGNTKSTYKMAFVKGRGRTLHRLAFIWVTGENPKGDIDHINRDKHDNRWSNLRVVTRTSNRHNCDPSAKNTSGVVGVCWHKDAKAWVAQIKKHGKNHHLGLFREFSDAVARRKLAEKQFYPELVAR